MKWCKSFNRFYLYDHCIFDQQIETVADIHFKVIVYDWQTYLRRDL